MPEDLIRNDLCKHADDRLDLWLKDHLTRYHAVDLTFNQATSDLTLVLTAKLCSITLELGFSPLKIARLVLDAAKIIETAKAAREAKEESL